MSFPAPQQLRAIPHNSWGSAIRESSIFLSVFFSIFFLIKLNQWLFGQFGPHVPIVIEPAGIGLAAVYLGGTLLLIPVALAWFFGMLTQPGAPILEAFVFTIVFSTQAIIGSIALRRLQFIGTLEKARHVLSLAAVALLLPIFTASLLTGYFWFTRSLTVTVSFIWERLWMGNVASMIIFTPLITTWWLPLPQVEHMRKRKIIEAVVSLVLLATITYLLFWTTLLQLFPFLILMSFVAVLLWIALRMNPRIMKTGGFIVALICIGGAFIPHQRVLSLEQELLTGQYFIILLAPVFSFVTALTTERRISLQETEQRKHELEITNKRLARADESKNQFIATLAHELRNPLAVTVNLLELFKIKVADRPDLLEIIQTMEAEHGIMVTLIDDLLDVNRLARNRVQLHKEWVDVQSTLERALVSMNALYKENRHQLIVVLPEEDLQMYCDPTRLQQIVINILTNAAKYTDPGGIIRFTALHHEDTHELHIIIEDTGRGIEPHMLERIFEPFVQTETDSPTKSGLGIGLALAQRLAELHGGRIWAESKGPGTGSTFYITLPLGEIKPIETTQSAGPTVETK